MEIRKEESGKRLITEEAESTMGPEMPKCVNSNSPNSSYIVFPPFFTEKVTFFNAKPCNSLKEFPSKFRPQSPLLRSVTPKSNSFAKAYPSPVEPVVG